MFSENGIPTSRLLLGDRGTTLAYETAYSVVCPFLPKQENVSAAVRDQVSRFSVPEHGNGTACGLGTALQYQ